MTSLLDEGELPARGGHRPHLALTMGINDLIDGLGVATLDTGGCLCAGEARRLACDATIIPMVLGGDSMPLDVGRHQRLATAALRDALGHRDQGCAFPACQRPPRYCHAHHIVSWLDGGDTSLSNMCLLCEYHHTSCIAKDGTSGSTDAADPNSSPRRPSTPPAVHSTTHSGNKPRSAQRRRILTSGPAVSPFEVFTAHLQAM